jgi:FXSXX-COOH protein
LPGATLAGKGETRLQGGTVTAVTGDVADGLLPDVRGMSLADLLADDSPALDRALERILATDGGSNFNSFGSSI